MDTDVWSLRSLGVRNAVGPEAPHMLNNAVLAFEPGHPFVAAALAGSCGLLPASVGPQQGRKLLSRTWASAVAGVHQVELLPAVPSSSTHWRGEAPSAPAPPPPPKHTHTHTPGMWASGVALPSPSTAPPPPPPQRAHWHLSRLGVGGRCPVRFGLPERFPSRRGA
jgi:hypothetical protein